MMPLKLLPITWFCLSFFCPSVLFADIGKPLDQAKKKTINYGKRYEAVNPFFKTDGNGKVVAECWNAPPQMWDRKTALKLAKELVPNKLKKENPKIKGKDGSEEHYEFSDGTKVILLMVGEKCIVVGVYSPGYDGPTC